MIFGSTAKEHFSYRGFKEARLACLGLTAILTCYCYYHISIADKPLLISWNPISTIVYTLFTPILLIVFALAFLFICSHVMRNIKYLFQDGVDNTGIIIKKYYRFPKLLERANTAGDLNQYLCVEYFVANKRYVIRPPHNLLYLYSGQENLTLGKEVHILYDPKKPRNAIIVDSEYKNKE